MAVISVKATESDEKDEEHMIQTTSIKQDELTLPALDNTRQHSFWRNTCHIGRQLPDLYLGLDADGNEVTLDKFQGHKVMICFYLFTQCGVCAYSIGKLMGNYKKMAWASKLKVITIFRTDSNCLKAGLTDPTSPIPKILNCNCGPREMYPFVALADPDGRAAEAFGCNTSSFVRNFKMNYKSAPKMCKRLLTSSIVRKEAFFAAKHGAGNLLPSEFLIDEEGKLVDIMRATKSNEHMSAERISEFLLTSYGNSWTSNKSEEYSMRRRKGTARRTNSMML